MFTEYRAVRIRAIFRLPSQLRHVYNEPLVYIEYFSSFPDTLPRNQAQLYPLTPSRTTSGNRLAAVLPLSSIRLTCHLTPNHSRAQRGVWESNDLPELEEYEAFFLNEFSSHLMYGFMSKWKNGTQ